MCVILLLFLPGLENQAVRSVEQIRELGTCCLVFDQL
jgi:hypothetical protein